MENKTINHSLVFFIFYFLSFIFFLHPVSPDGDFFHHVNTGKYIIENHSFPYFDTYSFTAYGLPWIAHSWGMGLIFYFIYSSTGELGISAFVSLVAVMTLVLLRILLKTIGVDDKRSILLLSLAAVGLSIRFPSRPEIISYPFMIAILLVNELNTQRLSTPPGEKLKMDRHSSQSWNPFIIKEWIPRLNRGMTWYKASDFRMSMLYSLIILLWVNLYGSGVLLGLILLLMILAGNILTVKANKGLLVSIIMAIAAAFLNPNGIKSIFYFFLIPRVISRQGEWAGILSIIRESPLDYLYSYQNLILAFLVYFIFILFLLLFNFRLLRKYKFFVFLSLYIFIPFYAFRYTPHAILLSLPLVACIFKDMVGMKKTVFNLVLLGSVTYMLYLVFPLNSHKDFSSLKYYPSYSVLYLKDRGLKGKLFTNQRLGAYLSYILFPDIKVFIDTRDDLYQHTQVISDFASLLENNSSSREDIISLLAKYKADLVLGDYLSDGLSMRPLLYDKNWTLVYFTDRYFVTVPVATARELKLPVLDAIDPYSLNLAKPGMEKEAFRQYKDTFAIYNNPANSLFLTKIYYLEGNYDHSLTEAVKIQTDSSPEGNISEMGKNNLLAQIYLAKDDCPNTYRHLKKLDDQTKNAFIFQPGRIFPSDANQGYAFYYLLCQKDIPKGRDYLDLYLKQEEVSALEKVKVRVRFEELVKNQSVY